VIACRVSPKQKAEIVSMVRAKNPSVTTLAIGDGANDVNVITAAHVGIGISGLEGQLAARSSDYAIGQCKFLKRLLFLHGREAYRRNAYLICYMFYKNTLFVFPMFFYGFYSVFSGTPIYDNYLYQFFNLFFTGAPIMWFGIMDFEHSREKFMTKHKYYKLGFNDEMFNKYIFWRWIVYGIWQGALIYFVAFYSMQYADPNNGSASSELVEGQFAYLGVVTLANLKVTTSTSNFTVWTFFFSISQTLAFVLFFFGLNLLPNY